MDTLSEPQGAYRGNALVEHFFGGLKHDWIFKVQQSSRSHMKGDEVAYIKHYNLARLCSSDDDWAPIQYEQLAN